MISDNGVPKADDNNMVKTPEMFDLNINMEVGLPRSNDGDLYHKTFKGRVIDDDGKALGFVTSNPITNTRLYEVEYLDGRLKP